MVPVEIPSPALVTGATGFIGRRLVDRLLGANIEVRALVLPGDPIPPSWNGRVHILEGDIANPQTVDQAIDGCPMVFHLAAVVGDWAPEALFERVTVGGTDHVFRSAARSHARVVLASSIVVYGHYLRDRRCSEDHAMGKPAGPYGRSKQQQELLAGQFHERGGDGRVVRLANVYGPHSGPWVTQVTKVLATGTPSLVSGGNNNAGLVYVDNAADILLRAGGPKAVSGDCFNANDELSVSWRRYFGDLAELIGAPKPKSLPRWLVGPMARIMETGGRALRRRSRPPLTREAFALVSAGNNIPAQRARDILGHRTLVNYEAGLMAIADSLRSDTATKQ